MAEEEEFLFQLWRVLTPQMTSVIPSRIATDFLKIIYDPYIANVSLKNAIFTQKIELATSYILEVRKILNQYSDESREDIYSNIEQVILGLKQLTDNF